MMTRIVYEPIPGELWKYMIIRYQLNQLFLLETYPWIPCCNLWSVAGQLGGEVYYTFVSRGSQVNGGKHTTSVITASQCGCCVLFGWWFRFGDSSYIFFPIVEVYGVRLLVLLEKLCVPVILLLRSVFHPTAHVSLQIFKAFVQNEQI